MELYREEQEGGGAGLLDHYTFDRADLVDGSEIMRGLSPGISMVTNRDLAQFMVAVSDNSATNVWMGRVGMEKENAMLRAHGRARSRIADAQVVASTSAPEPRPKASAAVAA